MYGNFPTIVFNKMNLMIPKASGAGSNLLFYGAVGIVVIIILLIILFINFRANNKSKGNKEKA